MPDGVPGNSILELKHSFTITLKFLMQKVDKIQYISLEKWGLLGYGKVQAAKVLGLNRV
ncbi:MAG: hypothetical protein RLZZ435_3679 [Cyanobacteriota bacterium]